VRNTIDDVYISSDERLVTLQSEKGADILDANTGQSLFTFPVNNFQSIGFSLDLAVVAFLEPNRTVQVWNTHTRRHESIAIYDGVFHIALSPDGSQLAALSPSHMKLWGLKPARCLAHLEFDGPLQVEAQISFGIDGISVSLMKNSGGTQSWRISPNHNIDLTTDPIKNNDGTKSWLISRPLESYAAQMRPHGSRDLIENRDGTKLPMIFVPTTEELSNEDASAPCQSYRCDTDGEWILDQDGRRVLWIPRDERPRKIWNSFKLEKKVIAIQTESGKVYIVNFPQT
jgi:WD40 repeat protein